MASTPLPELFHQNLISYALGTLGSDDAKAIETYLKLDDPQVHETFQDLQNLVRLLGYAAPPVSPPPTLKARLLARIQTEPQVDPHRPMTRSLGNYDALPWGPSGQPGVSIHVLRKDRETRTTVSLLRGTPGSQFVTHRHRGAEDTLVLQGRCQDRYGSYQVGDFIAYPPNSIHAELEALGTEDCILLIISHQGFDIVAPDPT